MSRNFAIATLSALLLLVGDAAFTVASSTSEELENIQKRTGSKPDTTLVVIPHAIPGGGVGGTIWLRSWGESDDSYAQTALLDENTTVPDETDWKDLPRANMGYGDAYAIVQTGQDSWLIIRSDPGGFFKWAAACSQAGCASEWTPIP